MSQERTDYTGGKEPDVQQSPLEQNVEQDPGERWLKLVGLTGNPFEDYSSGDRPDLSQYFVKPLEFRVQDIMRQKVSVVFGSPGHGKSVLRTMVANKCQPKNPRGEILCIEYGAPAFQQVLEAVENKIESVDLVHHAQVLLQLAEEAVPALVFHEQALAEKARIRFTSPLAGQEQPRHLFISYTREDQERVVEIVKALEAKGVAVWYDKDLHTGHDWSAELEKQIETAAAVVSVFTRKSLASTWMSREGLYAQDHYVPVIPYLLEEVTLPIWANNIQAARTVDQLLSALPRAKAFARPSSWDLLTGLVQISRAMQFTSVLCLVDDVDTAVQGQKEKMVQLLASLMSPVLREVTGINFIYFLPSDIESLLEEQHLHFRLDRCEVKHLEWDEQSLRELIRRRMIAFSVDRFSSLASLGELCDSTLAPSIEPEIVTLSKGNPRAIVWLAKHLIEAHCNQRNPERLIQQETWDKVRAEWLASAQSKILYLPGKAQKLQLVDGRLYFAGRQLELSDHYDALLRCLVKANGRACSHEELCRAGWPGEEPDGISPKTLAETMRRLRGQIKEQGVDPNCIETVRKQGYRLRTV